MNSNLQNMYYPVIIMLRRHVIYCALLKLKEETLKHNFKSLNNFYE